MASYAERLRERAILFAKLLSLLDETPQASSLSALAESLNVSRSVLQNLVKVYRQNPKKVNLKVQVLALLMEWFEGAKNQIATLSDPLSKVVADIGNTMPFAGVDDNYIELADGFVLSVSDRNHTKKTISGYYIGYRFRGTNNRMLQTLVVRIYTEKDSPFVRWELHQANAEERAQPGQKIPTHRKKMHKITGFGAKHEKVLTCLGRRDGVNEMHMLNIRSPARSDDDMDTLRALYSSSSNEEAICRAMILKRQPDIDERNFFEIFHLIGDEEIVDEITTGLPISPDEVNELKYGMTLTDKGFQTVEEQWRVATQST